MAKRKDEMDITCCMVGCDSVSSASGDNGNKKFHLFPKDFNLCMLWVQNSGRAEFFEDFAFAGAEPFLNRYVCSLHFTDRDYVNPKDYSLGLLPSAVPIANFVFHKIEVKEEQFDEDYPDVFSDPLLLETDVTTDIKVEIENGDEVNASFSFSSTDDSCNDLLLAPLQPGEHNVYRETEEEKQLSNEFFTKYENAMRASTRRLKETKSERERRLKREALRARSRRSRESEEQKRMRRMKNALRAAFRRRNETPEQREIRKRKDMLRAQRRRKAETEAEARIRRYNDAVRAAFRRNNETEEQRMERKMKDLMRAAKRRSLETPEQREIRLRKDRERASKRRLLKRITEQMRQFNAVNDLAEMKEITLPVQLEPVDNHTQPLTMSSISSVASLCNESSNMDHLEHVLQFIESKTNKSKRKTQTAKSTERNERSVQYVDLMTNPDCTDTVNRDSFNNSEKEVRIEEGYQLTDISHSQMRQNPKVNEKNLAEHEYVESKRDSEEIMNMLKPEVIWS